MLYPRSRSRSRFRSTRSSLSLPFLTLTTFTLLSFGPLPISFPFVDARCANLCSGHGSCDIYSRCNCYEGYTGGDCSERICPFGPAWADEAIATDVAHIESECSNRGLCNRRTGECDCMDGFTGIACERTECADDCNRHGRCLSLYDFAKDYYDDKTSENFAYEYIWDAHMMYGCICDEGYSGHDCSIVDCPTGDDPLTGSQVNEVQKIKCVANTHSGYFVLYHQKYPSSAIYPSYSNTQVKAALEEIPTIGKGGVSVSFSSASSTACSQSGANIISVEFLSNFGPLAPLIPYTDKLLAGAYIEIAGNEGEFVTDEQKKNHRVIKGTKENDYCSGRGLCNTEEGWCDCYDTNGDTYGSSNGYGNGGIRGDCGYALTTIRHCPGEVACSGHGKCNSDDGSYKCSCAVGWQGGDCSERSCPFGLSWYNYPTGNDMAHDIEVECSNKGICDRVTGECVCAEGFYGGACEYMACGGGIENPCNGHGQCKSMMELALIANDNGDATDFTYGSDPNNYDTWDGHRIHGCYCDDGYEGYDCSLRTCPSGDDPATYGQSDEIQLFVCTATSGSFKLKFRQAETEYLPYDITVPELQTYLNDLSSLKDGILSSVGAVTLNYSSNSNVTCTSDGSNVVQINFIAIPSDVPAFIPTVDQLVDDAMGGTLGSGSFDFYTNGASVSTYTSVKGTTENDVCSNRGLCNRETGICECFPGFASSDGQNAHGFYGDCGYRVPKTTTYSGDYQ